jgi:soluble lytic murein transglycosylase-like protein
MRQLFLPACVCLVTWSGATNSDPRLAVDDLSGALATKRSIAAPTRAEIKSAHRERSSDALISNEKIAALTPDDFAPRDVAAQAAADTRESAKNAAPELSDEEIATILADLAIEPPVPSGEVVNNGIPTGIPLPPIAKPVIARTEEEVCGALTEAAHRNGLPAPFFIRLLFQESRFKPGIVSSAGAQGVAQFMPETAADMGLDNPFDPLQAIPASARLLRGLFEKFGNLGLAAAAYNAGPKRIQDWLASKNKSKNKLPEETQGYVKTITGKAVENWSAADARHAGPKLPRRAPCQEAAGLLAWNGPDAVPLPSPAPLRVAAIAAAEKSKVEKSRTAKAKAEPKTAGKPQEKEKPKATTQAANKHEHKHKPERIAQR